MITWLFRMLGILLFGRQQAPVPVDMRSNGTAPIRYGRVELRPYINYSKTGSQYVKFTIKRVVGHGDNRSTSLHLDEVDDVLNCIRRLQAWSEDNGFSE